MCSCKACVFFFIPSCFPSWENYSLPTCTALSKVSGTKWAVSKCLFRSYRYRKVDNLTFGRDQSPLLRKSRLRELNLGAEQTNGGGRSASQHPGSWKAIHPASSRWRAIGSERHAVPSRCPSPPVLRLGWWSTFTSGTIKKYIYCILIVYKYIKIYIYQVLQIWWLKLSRIHRCVLLETCAGDSNTQLSFRTTSSKIQVQYDLVISFLRQKSKMTESVSKGYGQRVGNSFPATSEKPREEKSWILEGLGDCRPRSWQQFFRALRALGHITLDQQTPAGTVGSELLPEQHSPGPLSAHGHGHLNSELCLLLWGHSSRAQLHLPHTGSKRKRGLAEQETGLRWGRWLASSSKNSLSRVRNCRLLNGKMSSSSSWSSIFYRHKIKWTSERKEWY